MKPTAALLALAALASCTDEGDDYPTATTSFVPHGTSTAATITGRVCLVIDPRTFRTCAPGAETGGHLGYLSGLAVSLGGNVALTDSNGNFTLPVSSASATTVQVSGPGIVPSSTTLLGSMPAPTTVTVVPVLPVALNQQMLALVGVPVIEGQGTVLLAITDHDGTPVSGVSAGLTPPPTIGPFFDGKTATTFQPASTGSFGVMWAPGVTVGPVDVTLANPQASGESLVDGIQVIDGGITFVSTQIP